MKRLILLSLLAMLWNSAALAAHDGYGKYNYNGQSAYSDNQSLEYAAKDLEKAAKRLYRRLKKETGYSPLANEARLFYYATSDFREQVNYGKRYRKLNRRFENLSDNLYKLKYAYKSGDYGYLSNKSRRRLDNVLYAYKDVEQGLNAYRPQQYSYHFKRSRPGEYRR